MTFSLVFLLSLTHFGRLMLRYCLYLIFEALILIDSVLKLQDWGRFLKEMPECVSPPIFGPIDFGRLAS